MWSEVNMNALFYLLLLKFLFLSVYCCPPKQLSGIFVLSDFFELQVNFLDGLLNDFWLGHSKAGCQPDSDFRLLAFTTLSPCCSYLGPDDTCYHGG